MTHMLTDEQIEVQVAQLEAERDALLAKTEIVRLGKRKTNHTMIKSMYSTRINRLRRLRGERYQMPADTLEHRRQVNIERYGYPQGNVKKISATKKERYGNAFCDQAKARKTKRERWGNEGPGDIQKMLDTKQKRYGNKMGDIDKMVSTKIERYGDAFGNRTKINDTKLQLYGNIFGDKKRMQQTNMERYGVPFFCMHQKCRDANGCAKSKVNHWWHDKLLQELGIDCGLDNVTIGFFSYDLSYANEHCKLLIEINPTVTHNSTYDYKYYTGKSAYNNPISIDTHLNKLRAAVKNGYRLITVFDWMHDDDVIAAIDTAIHGTVEHPLNVELDLCIADIGWYIDNGFDINPIRIDTHWCKIVKRKHAINHIPDSNDLDIDALLTNNYVKVYDCGHALPKLREK